MMKVRGSRHDTGEVLRLLLDLGARPAGRMAVRPHVADRRQCARLRDAAARGRPRQYPEPLRLSVRHQRQRAGLALLRRGRGAALLHLRQDRARRAGPARRARLSDLRSEGHQVLPLSGSSGDVMEAGTIAELASKIGLEPKVLTHTVEEFNRAVLRRQAVRSAAARTAGRPRASAIPKSNWAKRIDDAAVPRAIR